MSPWIRLSTLAMPQACSASEASSASTTRPYFILAWGQLEAEINRVAEAAVRARRASVRWEVRRAWDAYDPDNMRAKFEDRAALVLDRFNTSSDAYRRTIRYYGWRNAIAHGTNLATGIDVASTIADFHQIQSELTP